MDIFHSDFVVDQHTFDKLVELLDPESHNDEPTERRLIELLMKTQPKVLQQHFDYLFDYTLRIASNQTGSIGGERQTLLYRVLDAESRKYTLMMLSEKLVNQDTNLLGKYLLHLYLCRYLLMPSVDKFFDTLLNCLDKAGKAASEFREEEKDKPTIKAEIEFLDQQFLIESMEALQNTQLEGKDFYKVLNVWLGRLGCSPNGQHSKAHFLRMWKNRSLTMQDALSNGVSLELVSLLYFQPTTTYVYSSEYKFSFLIEILGRYETAFRDRQILEQTTNLLSRVKFQGGYFRQHRMDDVLYRLVNAIGSVQTVTQHQMASFIKAVESIPIAAQTQLLLWELVQTKTTHHNFKSFCIGRYKAFVGELLSNPLHQRRSWKLITRVLTQLQQLSVDSGGLFGEIVNFAVMLKLKLKLPLPEDVAVELARIRKQVEGQQELSSSPEFGIALFRIDQFLS